ncbi:MAG TPA: protein translocase subunit SecD, partial [Planctomycetota bacterium]|nr:protein translocase subunit SecD [Planctomycetota bacterium]
KISHRGEITGDFSSAEVDDLVAVLQAGSLPVVLELQSKTFVGPELGIDSRDRGYFAVKLSFGLVVVFMLVYYLLSGAIADLALAMNLLFLFAAMMLTDAVLTLPGMAGIILTVGMAVDANVLIYERVREELDQGQALRFAVRNGYDRAFTTILDANLTTLITAIILYALGTGAVRGFAVTLSIGIVVSMFTALFVTRTVFDLLLSRGWLKERLKMLRFLKHTEIRFVKRAPVCIFLSVVLIAAGIGVFIWRGHDNYGIDFASGTSMQLQLKGYAVKCSKVTAAAEPRTSRFTVNFFERKAGGEGVPVELTQEIVDEGLRRLEMLPGQLRSEASRLRGEMRKLVGDEKLRAERRIREIEALHLESVSFDGLEPVWDDAGRFASVDLKLGEPTGGTGAGDALARFIEHMGERVFRMRMNIKDVRRIVTQAGYGAADVQAAFRDESIIGQYDSDQFSIRVRARGAEESQEDREKVPADIEQAFTDSVDHRSVIARVQVTPVAPADNVPTGAADSVRVSFFDPDPLGDDNTLVPTRLERPVIERALRDAGYADARVDWSEDREKSYAVITFRTTQSDAAAIKGALEKPGVFAFPVAFEGTYFVGPGQAHRTVRQAWLAGLLSLIAIVVYVWLRFGALKYGLAAVVALAHDVLFTLGVLAAAAWLAEKPLGEQLGIGDVRLSLPIVAGILTIIGYSLNDTIVVFDRIRENVRRRIRELRGQRSSGETLTAELIDRSVNQTLSRTLLTSLTTLIVCVTLYVVGGVTLHGLALCLIVGVVVGTYSSIFIASPILVLTHAVEVRRARAAGTMTTEEREVARERGGTDEE